MTDLLAYALRAVRAGLAVLPPKQDGSKAPDTAEWKSRQEKLPTESEIEAWYANGAVRTGIGFVCGAVSGNLEALDFDQRGVYSAYKKRAKECGLAPLLERVEAGYIEKAPNGAHLLYRCSAFDGNVKLASRPRTPEEIEASGDSKPVQVLIETRGTGGYIVAAPSCGSVHPSGQAYELVRGNVETIVSITPEERESLHELARSFDELPRKEAPREAPRPRPNGGTRPGDAFNAQVTWPEVLEPHGYVRVFEHHGETYWRRPGKSDGTSATTNYKDSDLLYVFSTSTVFEAQRGYDKFGAYAVLNHGGDLAAAARDLAAQGYGSAPPAGDAQGHERRADTQDRDPGDGHAGGNGAPPPPESETKSPPIAEICALALDLDELRDRPSRPSPLPGFLPEDPCLVLMPARPKCGKSRLAFSIAQAAACGAPPWLGAPPLDFGRVAIVSAEGTAKEISRMLETLHLFAKPERDRTAWTANLKLFARDKLLDSRLRPLLCLDSDGLTLLRQLAKECGLIVLDSLSRLKPPGYDENNPDHMSRLLGEIQEIGEAQSCYFQLIHHQGHADRDDPVSVARGTSALSAVPRAIWTLDRVAGQDHLRKLRVRGNEVPDREWTFEVRSEDADPGMVFYFRPVDEWGSYPIEDLMPVGEEITTSELARRLAPEGEVEAEGTGKKNKAAAGRYQTRAARLRESWKRAGLVVVTEGGAGKPTLIRRVR